MKFRSFRVKLTVILVLSMLFSGALSNFLIYEFARRAQFTQLQDKLISIARTATLMVDADMLLEIPRGLQGMDTPQYKGIRENLLNIKKVNPSVKYIYTMAKTDEKNIWQFMVDPSASKEDSYPGYRFNATGYPAMQHALEKAAADNGLKKDPWGVSLSGYAPIYNKSGKAVAILGVDMAANDVYAIQKEVTKRALSVLVIGIILAMFIAIFIADKVSSRVKKLTEGTRHIARGDLGYRVRIGGADEISSLAGSFNKMAADLKDYMEQLKKTTAEKERIESELKIAREIQTSFLPRIFPPFPHRKEFGIFATMEPAREVGGDFYDFFFIDKDKLCFLVGDVSGKGIPAALFMSITKMLLKTEARRNLPPDEILYRVNNILFPENDSCMFTTVLCVVLDTQTGRIQLANAGHNPPLLGRHEAGFEFFSVPSNIVLGVMENAKFENMNMQLNPNDIIFLYTDGVTEAMNPRQQLFSEAKLKTCLCGLKSRDTADIIYGVMQEIRAFAAETIQSDDITMLTLKYMG